MQASHAFFTVFVTIGFLGIWLTLAYCLYVFGREVGMKSIWGNGEKR